MPQRSNDFQKLIHFLEGQLAPEGAKVSESVMLEPLDGGEPVEVDVLLEVSVGHHPLKIAIECRDHSRPATVAWVNELAGRYAVLPVDRVVAVSRAGFSKGARHRAIGTKVQAFTLHEAQETDWPSTFHGWRVAYMEFDAKAKSVRVMFKGASPDLDGPELLAAPIVDSSSKVSSTVGADARMLYQTKAAESLRKWWPTQARAILNEDPPQPRSVDLPFYAQNRFMVAPDGKQFEIEAIVITVVCAVRLQKPDGKFYEYNGARVSDFSDAPAKGVSTSVSVLLDPNTGFPRAANVRRVSV